MRKPFFRSFISKYPEESLEDLYDHLPEKRKKYAVPVFMNDDEFAGYWLSLPYTPKAFGKDSPEYYTIRGERVRSKSEVIIADRLFFTFESDGHPLDLSWLDDFINKNYR